MFGHTAKLNNESDVEDKIKRSRNSPGIQGTTGYRSQMQNSNTASMSKDGKISPKMGPVKKNSIGISQSKIPKISAENYNKYTQQNNSNLS